MKQEDRDGIWVGVQLFWMLYAFGITVFAAATESVAHSFALGGILMFTIFTYWKAEEIYDAVADLEVDDGPDTVRLEVTEK